MASHPDYPRTRLYLEQPLHAGMSLTTGREQAHYLHHVLRLKTDDTVAVFNGGDGEWLARIGYTDKSSVSLHLEKQLRPQKPSPDIELLFAPLKGGKTEFIIEKATELGVRVIQPVYTQHTIVNRLNQERLHKLAVEAAEQCERVDVPQVREAQSLEITLSNWPKESGRTLFFCDESGKGENPLNVFRGMPSSPPLALFIGPEGGFSAPELKLLHHLPYAKALSLGPRILKADTAVIAALACVMLHSGDWDDKPAFRTI